MATRPINKSTVEEKLIWWGVIATWPVYFIGGLYVLGAVLGWLILLLVLLRCLVEGGQAFNTVPGIAWLWVIAMIGMEIALLKGHVDWSLGMAATIKSSIGWAKGWALMGLFILLGSTIRFDPAMLIRAVTMVCAFAIVFFIVSFVVYLAGGPQVLFVSPLKIVGGPGPEYFELRFYGMNPETHKPRWFFFAPWAPAAGLLSCLFLVICLQESVKRWRVLGVTGCLLICVFSQSRAALAIILIVVPFMFALRYIGPVNMLLLTGVSLPLFFLVGYPIVEYIFDFYLQVKDSRPDSTRVRSTLADIALQRWMQESPIWGHGIVERGPKIVEYMPIGSHHSWYGLLFTKGIVGVFLLAIPFFFSVVCLLLEKTQTQALLTAFCLLLVLVLYSFFENLEMLVYLYWPALLLVGYALNPQNNMPITVGSH